jgi:hypothetical protein
MEMSNLEDSRVKAFENYGIPLDEFTGRHPSTQHMIKVLAPNVNLSGNLYDIADQFFTIAVNLLQECQDGPELTAGLRKLLEAKDCFVRAALDNNPVDYRD